MLFYLFSAEELQELFERLGYPFKRDTIPRTVDYYRQRSANDSTLSRVAGAWVLARADRPRSWDVLLEALLSDVADIQGGTTAEGVHLGAMAGTVDVLPRCYTGLELRRDVLWLNPRLPEPLRRLRLFVRYRGHSLGLDIWHDRVEVSAVRCAAPRMRVASGTMCTSWRRERSGRFRFRLRLARTREHRPGRLPEHGSCHEPSWESDARTRLGSLDDLRIPRARNPLRDPATQGSTRVRDRRRTLLWAPAGGPRHQRERSIIELMRFPLR